MKRVIKSYLGYEYINIGHGKHGKIPYAISFRSEDVMSIVTKLNNEQGYNIYLRLNADFYTPEPSRIRDQDCVHPDIYVIDIDQKDNPDANIEANLVQFISKQGLRNYFLQFTGHGYQLWIRCDPVETVQEFKINARRLKAFIEDKTGLVIDFVPNPSRYGRFPGTVNYNPPIREGRMISWKTGRPFDINRCPFPSKKHLLRPGVVSCGENTTTPPLSSPPPKEVPGCTLKFIHSPQKRDDVLRVLLNPRARHTDRVWMVGFLKYCGLSKSRTLALIHRNNQWADYDRTHTRYQVLSVRRVAGRRA